jgi:heme exporter protein C
MRKALTSRNLLIALSAASFALLLWMVFLWAPTETNQGAIYRSVFFHAPLAWVAMLGMAGVSIASVAYLKTKDVRWDRLAVATAETGVVAGALMLLSGMIWAKPVWGTWWTGEAKLNTALIMFFIYVAYLMFRAFYPPGAQRARIAAIIALIGAIDSVIVYVAADLWARAHPPIVIGPAREESGEFASEFGLTVLAGMVAFSLLYALIVMERYRSRADEDDVADLRRRLDSMEAQTT